MSIANLFNPINQPDDFYDIYCNDLFANNIFAKNIVSESGSISFSGTVNFSGITFNTASGGVLNVSGLIFQSASGSSVMASTGCFTNLCFVTASGGTITTSGTQFNVVNTGLVLCSGNIVGQGYVQNSGYMNAGAKMYNRVGSITGVSSNTQMNPLNFPDSIYYISTSGANITFTLPNAGDIVAQNNLAGLYTSSTFTFILGNYSFGSTVTLANSLSGDFIQAPTIYMPANTSGMASRICTVVCTTLSPASFIVY